MTTPQNAIPTTRFAPHAAGVKDRAYGLFARRHELAAISAKLQVPIGTLRKWSSVNSWKARRLIDESKPSGISIAKKQPGLEEEPDAAFEELKALSFSEQQASYRRILSEAAMKMALTIQRSAGSVLVQQADKIAKLDAVARKALYLESPQPECVINVALLAGTETRPLMSLPRLAVPRPPAVEMRALAV